jgi:hypothetical protein
MKQKDKKTGSKEKEARGKRQVEYSNEEVVIA